MARHFNPRPNNLRPPPRLRLQTNARTGASPQSATAGGADLALKHSILRGVIPDPRMFIASGFISQIDGHGDTRGALDPTELSSSLTCCGGGGSVLRSAIVTPVVMPGLQEVVRVEGGFWADLLVLNGNLLEYVEVLARQKENLLTVVKEGRVVVSRWRKLDKDFARPRAVIE